MWLWERLIQRYVDLRSPDGYGKQLTSGADGHFALIVEPRAVPNSCLRLRQFGDRIVSVRNP